MFHDKIYVVNSWDDVTTLDLKICEMLESYNIKGSFYSVVNWIDKKILKDELMHISEMHEVGSHTLNHVDLKSSPLDVAKREIISSKELLENILEKDVTSFVYPNGSYNKTHVKIVEEAKYLCARTTRPFYIDHAMNPYETNVTIWTYPHALRDLSSMYRLLSMLPRVVFRPYFIKKWDLLGKQLFDLLLESGGVFHFYGHSWQIDEIDGWKKLEELLSHIAYRKNVSYVTMTELTRQRTKSEDQNDE